MSPEELLLLRYGSVPLIHVGNLQLTGAEQTTREMAIYAARIKSRNMIACNLLIVNVPLAFDDTRQATSTLKDLKWVAIYQRSYSDLKHLQATVGLDWSRVRDWPEHQPDSNNLPEGMWIKAVKEVREKTAKGRYYTFIDPLLANNYLLSVEARVKNATYATGLREEYEFDMLLSFDNFDLAIERFEL